MEDMPGILKLKIFCHELLTLKLNKLGWLKISDSPLDSNIKVQKLSVYFIVKIVTSVVWP